MSVAATKSKWLKDINTFAKQRRRYNWKVKRQKDRRAQEEYFEEHPYCQVCLAEGRGRRPADEVHEILYRSQGGKCIPKNEISTCRPDHDRMHFLKGPFLHRDDLFEIKRKEESFEANRVEKDGRGDGRYV